MCELLLIFHESISISMLFKHTFKGVNVMQKERLVECFLIIKKGKGKDKKKMENIYLSVLCITLKGPKYLIDNL